MTAQRDEWFDLASNTTKKLREAEADIVMQSMLREAVRVEMETLVVGMR